MQVEAFVSRHMEAAPNLIDIFVLWH